MTPDPNLFYHPLARRPNVSIGNYAAITANSFHPGGVNVGFADGSVKFIKNSVSMPTWWALGSRNGGEVVSSDAY